jgi:hypothetical protein
MALLGRSLRGSKWVRAGGHGAGGSQVTLCVAVPWGGAAAAEHNSIELQAHHLFDAAPRPNLAALEDNLLVISSGLHHKFHKWMGNRPCEPKDFVDYLLRNELTHFGGNQLLY